MPKSSRPRFGSVFWVVGCLRCAGCDISLGVTWLVEHPWSSGYDVSIWQFPSPLADSGGALVQ